MIKLALPGMRDYFAQQQIASGVPAGTEMAINAFRESIAQHGRDPDRVALFIDSRNAFNEIDGQLILDAVVVYAPDLARYVI